MPTKSKNHEIHDDVFGKEAYDAYMALDSYYRPPIAPTIESGDGRIYVQWWQLGENSRDQTKISDELAEIAIEWGEMKQKENAY